MNKGVLSQIKKLEKAKQSKLEQLGKIQTEINDLDNELKKYYSLQKSYENLEKKFNDLINGDTNGWTKSRINKKV